MSDDQITEALNSKLYNIRRAAIQNPKAQGHHIDKALDDEEWWVRLFAIRHPNVQSHHIDKALNDENWAVRQIAYHRPLTTDDQKIEYKLKWNDIDD